MPWVEMHIRRERQWVDIAGYLRDERAVGLHRAALRRHRQDSASLLALHRPGAEPHDDLAAGSSAIRDKVRDYYRQLDGLIGELRGCFAGATIVVASDHGFGPQVRTFYVNSWLERQGLLAWQRRPGARKRATPPSWASTSWRGTSTRSTGRAPGRLRRCRAATASTS